MTEKFELQLKKKLELINLELDQGKLEQFYLYYQMLIETNKVMNLTAITEEKEVITKHFVDSLSLVSVIPELAGGKVVSIIDVGTGAGFPGIPLKIAFPECSVVLLDSLNKRVKFLRQVIKQLDLQEIKGIHGRAEDLGRAGEYRESFDFCVSRAVANLSTLSEYCLPFVKVNGCFISYKSGEFEEELAGSRGAIKKLSSSVDHVHSFSLAGSEIKRSFICIRKTSELNKKYPRKAGLPSKEPLK